MAADSLDKVNQTPGDASKLGSKFIKNIDAYPGHAALLDSSEFARLDYQHEAMRASLGGESTCFEDAFRDIPLSQLGGQKKKVLDIGTGTGIWAIEFAKQYPEVQVIGLDLHKPDDRPNLPSNVSFVEADMLVDLPIRDAELDIVHARFIIGGFQTTKLHKLWDEINRVLKPGGLFYSVEPELPWTGFTPPGIKGVPTAPGYNAFANLVEQSLTTIGVATKAVTHDIPVVLSNMPYEKFQQRKVLWTFWEWSEEPNLKKSGIFGRKVCQNLPDNVKTLCVERAKSVDGDEFDRLKKGFDEDVGKPLAFSACWMVHNWGTKLGSEKD